MSFVRSFPLVHHVGLLCTHGQLASIQFEGFSSTQQVLFLEFNKIESCIEIDGVEHANWKTNSIFQYIKKTAQLVVLREAPQFVRERFELGLVTRYRGCLF